MRRPSVRFYHRERGGEGAHIDLTMLETMAGWMGHPLYYTHFYSVAAIAALKTPGRA